MARHTRWHRLLASLLEEVLTPLNVLVMTEVSVITDPPKADIILLRREGASWTEEQRAWLADGLRDTPANTALIEFKRVESLNENSFMQILVYDYLYMQSQKLDRMTVGCFLISAKTPNSGILERLGFQVTEKAGVYASRQPLVRSVQVILLNELEDTHHNAVFKCFASRHEEQRKAFETLEDAGSLQGMTTVELLIVGMRRILMLEPLEDPGPMGWTPEKVMQVGREWIDSILSSTPLETLFTSPPASITLAKWREESLQIGEQRGLQIGEQRGLQIGEQRGLQIGEQKGRREEACAVLRRLLQRRFGELPEWATMKLTQAELATLEMWTDRVLDAASLEDVLVDGE